jgi:hypothetical protein
VAITPYNATAAAVVAKTASFFGKSPLLLLISTENFFVANILFGYTFFANE